MERTLSRRAAARSKFSSSDARQHLGAQGSGDLLLASVEELHHLLDIGAVVRFRDGLDAGTLAALDVVQQAGPVEGALTLVDVDGAGAEGEQAADEVHGLVDAAGRCVRPEVAAAVLGQLAGAFDAREVLGQADLDEGVALVVLEAHVEARLVALDEVGLEQQRLADGVGQGVVDAGDPVDGLLDAQRWRTAAAGLPVLAHAAAQALRLAHVEHPAAGVLHQVDAGVIGQVVERRPDLWLHGHHRRWGRARRPAG